MNNQITVTKIQNPFDRMAGRQVSVQPYVPGITLSEIMVQHAPPHIRARHLSVVCNGVICNDLNAELSQGDSVAIIPKIGDGGDGGCGGTIGQIAVVMATIAAVILMPAGTPLWLTMAAASAVSITGSLIVNGLFPTPKSNFPQISGLSDEMSGSLAYGWTGPQTSWTPGLPYPELFGKMRLGGQIINYYIDTNNFDSRQTINLLLVMCEGEVETPVANASEILINNKIKLDTLEVYDFYTTKGVTDQDCLSGFDKLHQYRELSIEIATMVILHLHGDDDPLVDSSPSQKTLTVGSGATLDTTNKKFGMGSIFFDGTVNAYIHLADSDDWDLSDKNFSFSYQFRFIAGQTYYPILCHYATTTNRWMLFYNSDINMIFFQTFDAAGQIIELSLNTSVLNLVEGVFYHIELNRNGENWGIWVNGVQKAWLTSEQELPDIAGMLRVGSAYIDGAWRYHYGYLDEPYFVNGKALHFPKEVIPNEFSPPTEAYSDDDMVILHLHGDEVPFVDSSPSQKALTIGSGICIFDGKFYSSIFFDGTVNAYIHLADSDDWDLSDKNFSFSYQFRFIAGQTYYPILCHYATTTNRWMLFYNSDINMIFFQTFDAAGQIIELSLNTSVLNLVEGVFYHIELNRNGENWGIWVNGVQKAWLTSEQELPDIAGMLRVGSAYIDGAWRYHYGYLDEPYFVNGKALHFPKEVIPNEFSPPTEAYSDDTHVVETKGKVDELTVQVVFPHGLYEINTSAVLIDRSCDFSICYRQKDTSTWYLRQGKFGYTSGGGGGLSEPDKNDVIVGATSGAEGKFVSNAIDSGDWLAGTAVGDFVLKDAIGIFETSENLNNSTKSENNIVTLSATAGDIQHHERVTAKERNQVRRQYLIDCQAGRQNYEVKLTRISKKETETIKVSDFYWTGLDEILDETLKYPYVSLLGLSIEASEQLQGAIRNVAAVWDRGNIDVKNFNGVGTTSRASSNAAWASMFLLTTREGVDPTNIDETSWTAWANWCDGMVNGNVRITCNGVLDSQTSVAAALEKFEQIGRAKIIKTGQKYRVVIEKPLEGIPTQGFSTGNITEGSFQLEFLDRIDRPDVYNIEFLKESEEFRKDKVPVYSANYSSLTRKPKHESIFLWGCTDEDVARRYGLVRMQMSDKLNRFVALNADVDAIACQVGDVIKVVHDGNKLTFGGRLENQAGSPWTTIKLDQKITLDAATYSGNCTIWIQRGLDDIMLERTVTGPWDTETDEITISAAAENVAKDDVWAIGRTTGEVIKYRNTDFARTVETKFRIGALEYNPDVYYHSAYDSGNIAI